MMVAMRTESEAAVLLAMMMSWEAAAADVMIVAMRMESEAAVVVLAMMVIRAE